MATLVKAYVGELFKRFGRFAPWTPDVPIRLGAVGVLEDGEFRRKTTLASLGIRWTASKPGPVTVLDHTSSKGAKVTMKAKGQTLKECSLGEAEAGASLSFSGSGGLVLQASGVRVRSIEDADAVARAVLDLYENHLWEPDWIFVDEVHSAQSTTVVVSEESNTQLDLRASGRVAGQVPLSGDFEVAFKKGGITSFVGEAGFTPLFHLSRVKSEWFETLATGRPKGRVTGARAARPMPSRARPKSEESLLEAVTMKR